MERKSFLLFLDSAAQLDYLTDEECGRLFRAIFAYQASGEMPHLSPIAMMAFTNIRLYLDRNQEKYLQTCEKRRAAGKISAQVRREAAEARRAAEAAAESAESAESAAEEPVENTEEPVENIFDPVGNSFGDEEQVSANVEEFEHMSANVPDNGNDTVYDSGIEYENGTEHESDNANKNENKFVPVSVFGSGSVSACKRACEDDADRRADGDDGGVDDNRMEDQTDAMTEPLSRSQSAIRGNKASGENVPDGTGFFERSSEQQCCDSGVNTDASSNNTAIAGTGEQSIPSYQNTEDDSVSDTVVPYAIPDREEVRAYCKKRQLCIDPDRFWTFYNNNNWITGIQAIRDWKALARGWSKQDGDAAALPAADPRRAVRQQGQCQSTPSNEMNRPLTPDEQRERELDEMLKLAMSRTPEWML